MGARVNERYDRRALFGSKQRAVLFRAPRFAFAALIQFQHRADGLPLPGEFDECVLFARSMKHWFWSCWHFQRHRC